MAELPTFNSVEEMMAYSKKMEAGNKTSKRKQQKDNKKQAIKTASNDAMIYEVLHMYTRPGDNFHAVKQDGQTRYKMTAANFWVCAHNHDYTKDCTNSCIYLEREQ